MARTEFLHSPYMKATRFLLAIALLHAAAFAAAPLQHGGKTYKTVKIGEQTWMAENLNFEAEGSRCYKNKPENCAKYGRLYNWQTAIKVCPEGWHLPSKSEYETLEKTVGGKKMAGKKLKTKSGWNNNGYGTDEFGFSALPGGFGSSVGSSGAAGDFGIWWSASESSGSYAYRQSIDYSSEDTNLGNSAKSGFFSVRCLQD